MRDGIVCLNDEAFENDVNAVLAESIRANQVGKKLVDEENRVCRYMECKSICLDEFEEEVDQFIASNKQKEAAKKAKRNAILQRRREFSYSRPELILKMLNAGYPYVCAARQCHISENLEVDHIWPLSRGGTDELENLRFLCRKHNASKGDREQGAV